MNWIGAKRVKNHIKARKKFEIGLRVQEAPGSNPGTPTKKVLFSCENSTFSFKGKNIIEDELQFRVKVQFHYFYFMTLPPRALLGAAVF